MSRVELYMSWVLIQIQIQMNHPPHMYTHANIFPIFKKPSLDHEVLNHYRPVSNLPYLSKVIVASVITNHMDTHDLMEPLQSVYRRGHSTETALTYVTNDVLLALDSKNSVFLILLNLSAAFDTVNHEILLHSELVSVALSHRDLCLGLYFSVYTLCP